MKLIKTLEELRNSEIKHLVEERIKEFEKVNKKSNKEWFSELCFCLLTANTSAELGLRIQKELGYKGFTEFKTEEKLAERLKNVKYRFYNRRAHFIALANNFKNIKEIINFFYFFFFYSISKFFLFFRTININPFLLDSYLFF